MRTLLVALWACMLATTGHAQLIQMVRDSSVGTGTASIPASSVAAGGTVTGANQFRAADGSLSGDDLIADSGGGLITFTSSTSSISATQISTTMISLINGTNTGFRGYFAYTGSVSAKYQANITTGHLSLMTQAGVQVWDFDLSTTPGSTVTNNALRVNNNLQASITTVSGLNSSGQVTATALNTAATRIGTICISAGGDLISASIAGCVTSAPETKENIASLPFVTFKLLKLAALQFDFKPDVGIPGHQLGVISHDAEGFTGMETVFPELVVYGGEYHGKPVKSVNYPQFTAVLLKGFQEVVYLLLALFAATVLVALYLFLKRKG